MEIQNELSQKVAGVESIEEEISAVEKLMQKTKADLNALADEIHAKRTSVLKALSSEIENMIKPLGININKKIVKIYNIYELY